MFRCFVDHRTANPDQNVNEEKNIERGNKNNVIVVHDGSAGRLAGRPWATAEKAEENNNIPGLSLLYVVISRPWLAGVRNNSRIIDKVLK